MNEKTLSRMYFVAADSIQKLTLELYESVHDDKGNPEKNWDEICRLTKEYKKQVNDEVEAIKLALTEFNEQL